MSLAVLADHMASKGRGGDSMLIHMAPQEIAGLQALAVANGSSLTTNPDTGLPEALSLKKLLPAIIGFGLNYFVPGLGSAVGSALGTSAAVGTGVAVGGFEALRTGDLGKGISAGLGAYGGAGLSEGLMTAGSTEAGLSSAALNAELAQAQGLPEGLSSGDAFNKFLTSDANPAVSEALKNATPFERMTAGLDTAKAAPGAFLKDNFKYLAAGAAPILADQAVTAKGPQTVTKPGMIRPYSFDPYGGTYTAGTPYEAMPTKSAGGGLMGLAAGGIAGYGDGDDVPRQNGMAQGGMYDFAQRSEPVVRMADGGLSAGAQYAAANKVDVGANINKWIQDNPFATAADISTAIKTAGLTQEDVNPYLTANKNISDATRYALSHATEMPGAGGLAGMQANILKGFAAPNLTQAQIDDEQRKYGVSNADIQSPLAHGYQIPTTDLAKAENYLKSNTDVQAWLNSAEGRDYLKQHPTFDASDIAYTHFKRYGEGEGRTWEEAKKPVTCGFGMRLNAAGTACEQIICGAGFQLNKAGTACEAIVSDTIVGGTGNDTIVTKGCPTGFHKSADGLSCVPNAPVLIDWQPCQTGYHWDKAKQACVVNVDATQNTTTTVDTSTGLITAPATALPVGVSGTTGPSIFGGGSTVNPNGTITVSPVIPGIPVGGFTGMTDVRDAYEKGGGSLGVNKNLFVPKTQDELFARYKNTGGSKAAFDYLMGKTPYSPVPVTATGEIMKPYWESVGRAPINLKVKKYIFKDGKYELNPDYVKPSYVQAGEKAAADKAAADTKTTGTTGTPDLTDQSKPPTTDPGNDNEWVWDYVSKKWYASPIQRAAAGGLMAMARGGMGQQFNLGDYSDGGRLLKGPGDGVSDSIPATIGNKRPARLADGEFVVPARIVSELGNGSTEAGARKLYAMMDRVQRARGKTTGKGKVAKNSRADKYLPA